MFAAAIGTKTIKSFGKKIIAKLALNNFCWSIFNKFAIPVVQYAQHVRKTGGDENFVPNATRESFPNYVVHHGPFRGMKWKEINNFYSPQFPKLLGSYETELHSTINTICQTDYTEIVDIGCAEGYYAVGFAMRMPDAQIYAFDTDRRAAAYCQELARLNHVDQRLHFAPFCSPQTLKQIPIRGRALIFCDVEGYEATLFTEDTAAALAHHDLLIETHDFIDITISATIRKLFENSHECFCIESIDDIQKAYTYDYPELLRYDIRQRERLIAERRPAIQQWFYLLSKRPQDAAISQVTRTH